MKNNLFIAFILFCIIGLSQSHSELFNTEVIQNNNIKKILQYDINDSITFFEKYPNGYYSIYDKFGRLIESNNYAPLGNLNDDSWVPGEFKNYYLYDSLDNKIGFIQLHENFDSPFRFIELKTFDEENKKVKTVSLEKSWQVNSNFLFTKEDLNKKKLKKTDTVAITKFHKKVYYNGDSINYIDLFISKNNQIDSVIIHEKCSSGLDVFPCSTIISFEYYSNGLIKKKTEQKFLLQNEKKLFSQNDYYYLKNGLLDYIKRYYSVNNLKNIIGFKYYYRDN